MPAAQHKIQVGPCRICNIAVQRPAELCIEHGGIALALSKPKLIITIELPGEPKGKGRPRFSAKSGTVYTPPQTRSYEAQLKTVAAVAMRGQLPLDGAVGVNMHAIMSIPTSWSKKKQRQAVEDRIRPTTRPDADNLVKMLDSLNGVVWSDDKQIVQLTIMKFYGLRPRMCITVTPMEAAL